ncbi:hypothetical protein ACSW8S_11690 [Clostridium perfringens]
MIIYKTSKATSRYIIQIQERAYIKDLNLLGEFKTNIKLSSDYD